MQISARNQLKGTVTSVTLGTVMAGVAVDVGGQDIASAITRASAEQLSSPRDRRYGRHQGDRGMLAR